MDSKLMICPRCWSVTKPCDRCQSKGWVPNLQLSANFMLHEMLASPTAIAQRISNDPSPLELAHLMEACQNLFQKVRDALGPLKVTSGYRAPLLNQAIKGSKTSAHMSGYALDCQPQKVSLQDAMRWLAQSNLPFDQAILELGARREQTTDDWLHLGWKLPNTARQRRELLIMENGRYRLWKP